jgi:hypothetical protein
VVHGAESIILWSRWRTANSNPAVLVTKSLRKTSSPHPIAFSMQIGLQTGAITYSRTNTAALPTPEMGPDSRRSQIQSGAWSKELAFGKMCARTVPKKINKLVKRSKTHRSHGRRSSTSSDVRNTVP